MDRKGNLKRLPAKGGSVAEIEPPSDWRPKTKFGTLRCDDGRSGRMVRLADVVRWLMRDREMPRIEAALMVMDDLTVDSIGSWLYLLSPGAYAEVVKSESGFTKFLRYEGAPAEKLIRSLLDQIKSLWCDPMMSDSVLNQDAYPVNSLAVAFQKAHELWGWGHVPAEVVQLVAVPAADLEPEPIKTYAGLKAFRVATPGAPWTDDMRAALAQEEERRKNRPGAAGVRKKLGEELGCSDKRIGELIRQHEATKPSQSRRMG